MCVELVSGRRRGSRACGRLWAQLCFARGHFDGPLHTLCNATVYWAGLCCFCLLSQVSEVTRQQHLPEAVIAGWLLVLEQVRCCPHDSEPAAGGSKRQWHLRDPCECWCCYSACISDPHLYLSLAGGPQDSVSHCC